MKRFGTGGLRRARSSLGIPAQFPLNARWAVCCLLLFMALVTPEPRPDIDAAWSLGLLLAFALVAQQVARSISLPDVAGWMAAGLILGEGGMRAVLPAASGSVELVYTLAALWLGCLAGLGLDLRWERRRPPLPLVIFLSTLGTAAVFGGAAILLAGLSAESALALGALAALWGPIVASTLIRENEPVLAAALGSAFALILLSAVLLFAAQRNSFDGVPGSVLLRLWSSAAVGPLLALTLWRLRLLGTRTASVVALSAGFLLLGILVRHTHLFALIAGLGAGVVLASLDRSGRLRQMLEPGGAPAGLVFFAIAGASLDPVRLATSPVPGLYELLLLQLLRSPRRACPSPSPGIRFPWPAPGFPAATACCSCPPGRCCMRSPAGPRARLHCLRTPSPSWFASSPLPTCSFTPSSFRRSRGGSCPPGTMPSSSRNTPRSPPWTGLPNPPAPPRADALLNNRGPPFSPSHRQSVSDS